jgi:predicted O-methyltransferase YrrM
MAWCARFNKTKESIMMVSSQIHIKRVLEIIEETNRDGLLTDRRAEGLSGISGLKTVGALQRLAQLFADDAGACYLEIGVFQGLTLVSAALEAPGLTCFGIDNFATLNPKGENKKVAAGRIEKFGATNATLIDADFEQALEGLDAHLLGRKIGVYFVDGPHDYRSQMVCLLAAKRHLHAHAVIIVDDANYPDVRWSTRDFLVGHPDFKMVFEAYSPAHPANMDPEELKRWEDGWLNGVNILVRDPDGFLPNMLPPVGGDRTVYFNEWLAHRLQAAHLAPEAIDLAGAILRGDEEAEQNARDALSNAFDGNRARFESRHPDRNTDSGGLPEARFNALP